jgi:hypothetical protein
MNTDKDTKVAAEKQIGDPGNGKRDASLWGRWLTSLGGLNRQLLSALTAKESAKPGSVYYGTANAKSVAKRRARNKMARATHQAQRRAAKR